MIPSLPTRIPSARLAAILLLLWLPISSPAQWTTSRIHGSPEPPPPYLPEQILPRVQLSEALEMATIPGARRFAAVERPGKIWTFPDSPDSEGTDLLIDLKQHRPALQSAYGIAFHPRWRENGYVFLTYVEGDKLPDGSKLSRFRLARQEPPLLDPSSETVLLTWLGGGHNGASLQFGPDGMLYLSTGDATPPSPPDALNTGQNLDDLLSCILRINPDLEEDGKAYAIPPDNPFRNTPGACPEIWAFGFRNPWKMSFDAQGRLWCGDVGWELWEMIHLVRPGGNYGWSAYEASQPIKPETQGPGPIIPPVAAHPHSEAASITGGFVYAGSRLPALRGAYLYGDYETGKIWALWADGHQVTRREEIASTPHRIVTFGLGEDGEVYWMDYQKETKIYRLVPNPATGRPGKFPRLLSETGLFADTASQTPAPGVLPFAIAEEMWQDGATAQRWVAFPDGQPIQTAVSGNPAHPRYTVSWPSGSVLARTISLPPAQRRLETQLLHFDGRSWNGYSYRWNERGSDAELAPLEGEEFPLHDLTWRIHSRSECSRCHNSWSGFALGFQPDQLVSIAGSSPAGFFDGPFQDRLKNRLVSSRDETAPLEERARSWLHVNCAHCHRRHGGGSVPLMLNADLSTLETMMLDGLPVRGDLGLNDARIIAPGAPERSVLLARIARGGPGHMPMTGARELDPHGFHLLWDWIASLQPASSPPPPPPDSPSNSLLLVNAISRGEVPLDLRLLDLQNPEISGYFDRFRPPSQRPQTLGAHFVPAQVLSLVGDPVRGADLLSLTGKMAICLACHIIHGTGRDFGPDLSLTGARLSPEQILTSLHQPSQSITPGYETWVLTLRDGRQLTGFILNPGDSSVTLRLPSGISETIPRDQIRSQKVHPGSLMPEGLLQGLTAREAADLIAYLASLRDPG